MQIAWVTTGSVLRTLDLCDKAEAALTDALNKTGLPWEVSATLQILPMKEMAECCQPHGFRLRAQHMPALRGMLSLGWGTPSAVLLNRGQAS